MMRRLVLISALVSFVGMSSTYSSPASARSACLAPQSVCDTRDVVFQIKSFDPYGSAVRIGENLLVTNRHVVADEKSVTIFTSDGEVTGDVVPSAFQGDLVLIRAKLPDGPVAQVRETSLSTSDRVRTVGYDLGQRGIRVYIDGVVLALPAPGKALGRLHHTAHTQPGNSGGAVVDEDGQLVGIATSGGAGLFEAVPAASIKRLQDLSGPTHVETSSKIGVAYRSCILATEAARRSGAKLPILISTPLQHDCLETRNRQLIALAAQGFGQARDFETSEALFNTALELDPNAINSRLGLVVSLMYARKADAALPHIRQLLTALPANPTVHRMAIQAGKSTGDKALVATALDAIKTHNPKGLDAAERFLKSEQHQRSNQNQQNGTQQ